MTMKLAAIAVVLACSGVAQAQDAPPAPPPVVPPMPAPPFEETAPAPMTMPSTAPGVVITPLGISDNIAPGKSCDGLADPEASAIAVEAEGGTMTATLTGLTAAHCFIGAQSAAILMFELTQDFDIAPTGPGVTSADLTLAASLNGYLWARRKAQASVKLANAAVYDSAGNLVLSLGMPPAQVCGGGLRYQQEATTPPTNLPVGRYTLVAHFTIESGAGGLVRAHGTSVFSGEEIPGLWAQSTDPFIEEDRADYGFNITVTAAGIAPTDQARRRSVVQPASYQMVTPAPATR